MTKLDVTELPKLPWLIKVEAIEEPSNLTACSPKPEVLSKLSSPVDELARQLGITNSDLLQQWLEDCITDDVLNFYEDINVGDTMTELKEVGNNLVSAPTDDDFEDIEIMLPNKMLRIIDEFARREGISSADWIGKVVEARLNDTCEEQPAGRWILLSLLKDALDEEDIATAEPLLKQMTELLGHNDPQVIRQTWELNDIKRTKNKPI